MLAFAEQWEYLADELDADTGTFRLAGSPRPDPDG
jgi:hypothetical protein